MFRYTPRFFAAPCATLAALALMVGASWPAAAATSLTDTAPTQLSTASPIDTGGRHIEVTGRVLQATDPTDAATYRLFEAELGLAVPIDPATLPEPVEPGDTVTTTLEVPGWMVAALPAEVAIEAGADLGVVSHPLSPTSQAGAALLEMAVSDAVALEVADLTVLVNSPFDQAAPPAPHILDIAFFSIDGRGRFYSEAEMDDLIGTLSDWWARETKGLIPEFQYSYAASVAGQTTIQCSGVVDYAANEAARLFGHNNAASYWADNAQRHLIVLSPEDEYGGTCRAGSAGATYIGKTGLTSGGAITIISPSAAGSKGTLIHEIGHNLGFLHAGSGTCPAGVVDGPFGETDQICVIGTGTENYGDYSNMMGHSYLWDSTGLNGYQKIKVGILTPSSPGLQVIETSGSYDVALRDISLPQAPGLEVVKIVEAVGTSMREYLVEYDSRVGGVSIRRGNRPDDSAIADGFGNSAETFILKPGGTRPTPQQRFMAGQQLESQGGGLVVRVDQVTGSQAFVHVELNQARPWLSLSHTSLRIDDPETPGTAVVTTGGATWTATSDVPWLTVTSSGTSGATLTAAVAENTTGAARSGQITVAASSAVGRILVSQADGGALACGSFARACPWDLSPVQVSPTVSAPVYLRFVAPVSGQYVFQSSDRAGAADPFGGLYNFDLQLIRETGFGAGNLNFWLMASLEAGQTYYFAARHTRAPSSGQYTLNAYLPGQASVGLDSTSWSAGSAAGNKMVTVSTNQPPWSASSDQAWLTFTPATGSNGTLLTAAVTANTANSPRTGTITVMAGGATATFVVTQSGGAVVAASVALSASWWSVGADSDMNSVTVTTNQPTWSASSDQAWLLFSPATGTSGATLRVVASKNVSTAPRTGTITVTAGGASVTYTVTQAGAVVAASVSLSVTSLNAPAVSANTGVVVTTNQPLWSASSSEPWLKCTPSSGATGAVMTVSVLANTSNSPRTGTISVTADGATATLSITQAGAPVKPCSTFATACLWDLSPILVSPEGAAPHYLRFVAPVSGQYVFESSDRPSSADPYGSLFDSNQVLVAFNDDSGGNLNFSITATLVAGQTYYLTARNFGSNQFGQFTVSAQVPSAATVSLSPWTALTAPTGSARTSVTVTTNQSLWTATSDQAWLLVTPSSGASGAQLTVMVAANTSTSTRQGVVTVRAGGASTTLTVTQPGVTAPA